MDGASASTTHSARRDEIVWLRLQRRQPSSQRGSGYQRQDHSQRTLRLRRTAWLPAVALSMVWLPALAGRLRLDDTHTPRSAPRQPRMQPPTQPLERSATRTARPADSRTGRAGCRRCSRHRGNTDPAPWDRTSAKTSAATAAQSPTARRTAGRPSQPEPAGPTIADRPRRALRRQPAAAARCWRQGARRRAPAHCQRGATRLLNACA